MVLTHGNVIFDILEPPAFQKYSICWVFRAFFCSTFFYMYFATRPRPALTAVICSTSFFFVSAPDNLHEPMQDPSLPGKAKASQPKPLAQELRLLWRWRNFQPGAGSRLPHAWKEKETQAQPMLLIVDYNKDPQKDMNDNLQSIYQYL